MSDTNGQISRRSLVKGAAWAVPVIALASPVPAYAASQTVCTGPASSQILATTTTSMTVRFVFDAAASAGLVFEVLAVAGVDFDGINGQTVFPQTFPLGVPAVDLILTRSSPPDNPASGRVTVSLRVLNRANVPCSGISTTPFNYRYPNV